MPVRNKKSKTKPATHLLRETIEALRALADEVEQQLPVLDPEAMTDSICEMHGAITALRGVLPEAQRIPMKQYLQIRAAWLEAWSRDAIHLRRASRSVLKAGAPELEITHKSDPALEPLFWLVEVIAAEGLRKAVELTQWLAPEPVKLPDYGMAIDRDANHALQVWGRMKAADFLAKWELLNEDMIKRSAVAVGLPSLKRWPQSAREELHRRALRFVRNTIV